MFGLKSKMNIKKWKVIVTSPAAWPLGSNSAYSVLTRSIVALSQEVTGFAKFLALSATIEKPLVLKEWLEKVKKEKVNLIKYTKRFIVQQRYLWNDKLIHLHPLSCVDINYISNPKFLHSEMNFTPRDS